jgi:hypothetical protein
VGRGAVDALDQGVRVRRTHERGRGLAFHVYVIQESRTPGEQAFVFGSPDRLADTKLSHD